jgi:uncharacterized membrane protein
MKHSQLIGIIACIFLVAVCFLPWVYVPSINKTFSGAEGFVNESLTFGKQYKAHIFFCVLMIVCFAIKKIWAKRFNIFLGLLNLGWAIKNFIIFSMCRSGECPQVKPALYIVVLLAVIIQVMVLLPKMELKENKN